MTVDRRIRVLAVIAALVIVGLVVLLVAVGDTGDRIADPILCHLRQQLECGGGH